MAEGAPLLREYGWKLIEGSNPSLSATHLEEIRDTQRSGHLHGSSKLISTDTYCVLLGKH